MPNNNYSGRYGETGDDNPYLPPAWYDDNDSQYTNGGYGGEHPYYSGNGNNPSSPEYSNPASGGGTDSGNSGPQRYSGGDVKSYIENLLRGASGRTDMQAGMGLKDLIESSGAGLQIASDGTWRGRLNHVPGYGDVDLIGDHQTWGQGDWAWRIPGTAGYSSGGGGGAPSTPPSTTPTTPPAVLPTADDSVIPDDPQTDEEEKMLRELLTKMATQGTTVDRNSEQFHSQLDPFVAQQDRARRNFESEAAERLSAQGLGSSGAMENERRLGMERAGYNAGVFESQLVTNELQSRRDEIRFALESLGGMLSQDKTLALQRELKIIDNTLAREMANLEAQLKREGLAQDDRHFNVDAGIRIGDREAAYAPWNY